MIKEPTATGDQYDEIYEKKNTIPLSVLCDNDKCELIIS